MKKITTTAINNGFIEPVVAPEDYIFGGERSIQNKLDSLGVADEIIRPDGQWDAGLPAGETQIKKFDVFGCTVFNGTNQLEIQERVIFKNNPNYSDRAAYNMAEIAPPGADPNRGYEVFRKKGLLDEEDLPWGDDIDTLEKYSQPRPLPQTLLDKAKQWLSKYDFKHEYLPRGFNGLVDAEVMKEVLKHSCLAVAVQAWSSDGEKYVRTGTDTHWTVIYGFYDNGDFKCYDSYVPFLKRLDKNFGFRWVKRIWLHKHLTLEELSIFQRIVNILSAIVGLQAVFTAKVLQEKQEEKSVKPAPKESRIVPWAKAIETYENFNKSYNNPGAIKSLSGGFLRFKTYNEGFQYLCDYLTRACKGKHGAYPKGGNTTLLEFTKIYAPSFDGNVPETYCRFVAEKLGVPTDIQIGELL